MRPRLLDLFCGAGGCAKGYQLAGFEVWGVDNQPQPRYCGDEFIRADALMYLKNLLDTERDGVINPEAANACGTLLSGFDAIHASPPCQGYSAMARTGAGADKPKLIPKLRHLLRESGKPYVIENVEGAELSGYVVTLCGTMFGLRVRRHRWFEIDPPVMVLLPGCTCRHGVVTGRLVGQMLSGKTAPGRRPRFGYTESDRREAIGVPWMTTMEARQAIPPAYTEYVGKQLMNALAARVASPPG